MNAVFPYEVSALPVDQPLGRFYVAVLPAWLLLDTCYADRAKAIRTEDGSGYQILGNQRSDRDVRLRQIGEYINGTESAFPNSIILSANFDEETGLELDNESEASEQVRWRIEEDGRGTRLIIPTGAKVAPIIDGQHRLFAFAKARPERCQSTLVCSVFLDLPKPFQASLFATINSTQIPVDRSLTYDLFGYNVDTEPAVAWGPEKVAVFMTRKLGTEEGSPLKDHILVAAENDFALTRSGARRNRSWVVSTATVVQGIVRLISTNPRSDGATLQKVKVAARTRELLRETKDQSPLRDLYLDVNDAVLYTIVFNFFVAVDRLVWSEYSFTTYDKKTVGMQAFLDVLRQLAPVAVRERDLSVAFFSHLLAGVSRVDFNAEELQNPSGAGRAFIRSVIQHVCGIPSGKPLSVEDVSRVRAVLRS